MLVVTVTKGNFYNGYTIIWYWESGEIDRIEMEINNENVNRSTKECAK